MNDRPQKTIIDIGGSLKHGTAQAAQTAAQIGLAAIAIVTVILTMVISAGAAIGLLALIGSIIVVWYRYHPKFTSLFVFGFSAFLSFLLFIHTPVWLGIFFCFIALYGVLILPPPGIDVLSLKVKKEKLYSIAIVAFIQIGLAGLFCAAGYTITQSEYLKNVSSDGDARSVCVIFFALSGLSLYKGCINAKRQKDYLMHPAETIEQWKRDNYWRNLKYNVRHNPTGLDIHLYNEEAIKRGAKTIPTKKGKIKNKKPKTDSQIEWNRKFKVAKNVIDNIRNFGPK